jgi:hypothetical protein
MKIRAILGFSLSFLFTLIVHNTCYASATDSLGNYWQQEVHYHIQVTLDDTAHKLHAKERFEYINNSPHPLSFIYIHLWPNAYKDHKSAMAKQMLREYKTDYQFCDEEDHGYIDSLAFTSNGHALRWEYADQGHEIAIIYLPEPLVHGAQVSIETPFEVKIPETFSRMGHIGQSYQITQWYPKPAVFDKAGWNTMPYLDQGEFYSEFGSFEVSITLPENYVVGATGDLLDEKEKGFLAQKVAETSLIHHFNHDYSFPASSKDTKTLHYTADHVQDFGWFADKRYHVTKDSVCLSNGHCVQTWSLFTEEQPEYWKNGAKYAAQAIAFYSEQVGNYPYNNMTVVDGTITAGGGMEYPNVTVIGTVISEEELETVIAHEVGHNWFYGMLASNERDNPWMDEGINSYYEDLYVEKYHPDARLGGRYSTGILGRIAHFKDFEHRYEKEFYYHLSANQNLDQPVNIGSDDYTYTNYGAIVYSKTSMLLRYLHDYLDRTQPGSFDTLMRQYFSKWQYKHPMPEDFRSIFQVGSQDDISWFFKDLLVSTAKIDYKVKSLKRKPDGTYRLTIKNRGDVSVPINIGAWNKGDEPHLLQHTQWLAGDQKKISLSIPAPDKDFVGIDPQWHMPDINRNNNQIKTKGIFRKLEPIKFRFAGGLDHPMQSQINFFPLLGWNNGDKTMLGMAFYNNFFPQKHWDIMIAPMFGTGSKKLVGFLHLNYHAYPKKLNRVSVGVNIRSFSYGDYYSKVRQATLPLEYYKASPVLEIEFKNAKANSFLYKHLRVRPIFIYQAIERSAGGSRAYHFYNTNELRFIFGSQHPLHPYKLTALAQQCHDFMTLSAEANFHIIYDEHKNGVHFRVFGGGFLFHNALQIDPVLGVLPPRRDFSMSANPAAGNFQGRLNEDFTADELYLDRSGTNKVFSHQVFTNKEGGFRSYIPGAGGMSQKWIFSAGASSDLPYHIPIKPFVNIGLGNLYDSKVYAYRDGVFMAEAGVSLVGYKNLFEIHLPLVATNNIKEAQALSGITKWYERITFTLDLNLANPFEVIRSLKF